MVTNADALAQLETLIQTQQPAAVPWQPVTDYSEDARRLAEGPHARLILETFKPSVALDVGCGFNYLASWVNELAGHSVMYGMDKHNHNADFYDDIANWTRELRSVYDLVVCREVLEHVTLTGIIRAVRNLCALSSRYVYVTTRFAQHPDHFLSVDTSDDLDPTHITMLNQDLLRLLFVLEGFRRRSDLEQILDWQHKGRCLVYERA